MEDILASIKRIIAEDGAAVPVPRARRGGAADGAPVAVAVAEVDPSEILELTDPVPPVPARPTAAKPSPAQPAAQPAPGIAPDALISDDAASASRQALDTLSAMVVRTAPGHENTLDGLMRELLRPLLKQWLDARLPEIVNMLVAQEIARITGKGD